MGRVPAFPLIVFVVEPIPDNNLVALDNTKCSGDSSIPRKPDGERSTFSTDFEYQLLRTDACLLS